MNTNRLQFRRKAIPANGSWEEMKAARRDIDHNSAVQETDFLQKQYYQLWGHLVGPSPVDLSLILRTLTQKKIPFVLTGSHGIGGWTGRPRSTKDIHILVKGCRNHTRAVNAIKALYPHLEVRDHEGLMAFHVPGDNDAVIDVTFPLREDQEETLSNPTWTENSELGIRYRIPSLEEALANKYGAMLTPGRRPVKRLQDIIDFSWMVTHSMDKSQKPIDLNRLEFLGKLAWPGGGGKEFLRLVNEVKAGKAINLESLE